MAKMTISQRFYTTLFKTKEKIDRHFFKEISEIFDDKETSIDYLTCIPFNIQNQIDMKNYGKVAGYLEGSYQDILSKLATLITDINPHPSLEEILYIYCYIVRSGYLSKDNKFTFYYPEHELDIRKGLSISTGQAVCRNLSAQLSDLLVYFGYKSFSIMTDRLSKESDEIVLIKELAQLKEENDDVDKNFMDAFNEKQEQNDNRISLGNHVEVIAFKEGKYYMLDPTAICMYRIISDENEYPVKDFYRPWALYATGEFGIKNTCAIHRLLKDKYLKLYKSNWTVYLQRDNYKRCEKNKQKILEFRHSIEDDIDFINRNLEQI